MNFASIEVCDSCTAVNLAKHQKHFSWNNTCCWVISTVYFLFALELLASGIADEGGFLRLINAQALMFKYTLCSLIKVGVCVRWRPFSPSAVLLQITCGARNAPMHENFNVTLTSAVKKHFMFFSYSNY